MRIRRIAAVVIATAALTGGLTSPAIAAQERAPVIGAKNCTGRAISFFTTTTGVSPGQAAKQFGVPVRDQQQFIRAFCSGGLF